LKEILRNWFSKGVKKFKFNFIQSEIVSQFSGSKKKRELKANPGRQKRYTFFTPIKD